MRGVRDRMKKKTKTFLRDNRVRVRIPRAGNESEITGRENGHVRRVNVSIGAVTRLSPITKRALMFSINTRINAGAREGIFFRPLKGENREL